MHIEKPLIRTLYLAEAVNSLTTNAIIKDIHKISAHDKCLKELAKLNSMDYSAAQIDLYINSYGGSVYSSLALYDTIRNSGTIVHTHINGIAASAAATIALAGDFRTMTENSTLMIHQVSWDHDGKYTEVTESVAEHGRLDKVTREIYKVRTNISKKILAKIYNSKEDVYFNAEDCLKYGIVDKIIKGK